MSFKFNHCVGRMILDKRVKILASLPIPCSFILPDMWHDFILSSLVWILFPENLRHWLNSSLMLVQRRRRWSSIISALCQYIVFDGNWHSNVTTHTAADISDYSPTLRQFAVGATLVLMFGHCPLRCENVHRWRVHVIFAQYSIPSTPQYPLSRQTALAPHFSVPFCFLFGLTAWIGHTPRAQISHTVAKINLFRSVYKCCIWLNPCGTEAYTKHINPLPGAVEH